MEEKLKCTQRPPLEDTYKGECGYCFHSGSLPLQLSHRHQISSRIGYGDCCISATSFPVGRGRRSYGCARWSSIQQGFGLQKNLGESDSLNVVHQLQGLSRSLKGVHLIVSDINLLSKEFFSITFSHVGRIVWVCPLFSQIWVGF